MDVRFMICPIRSSVGCGENGGASGGCGFLGGAFLIQPYKSHYGSM